ncbi:hypothetical protein [Nocardioides sp. L-11A]|uniref:hypothetical protein n=1 Tax=Nocardioides sp. L-11A TaxID=3043848 RepID=UPI00249CF3D7|nr:hypothetical protein QJ852_09935 [Nocardioides sp. L-11A]
MTTTTAKIAPKGTSNTGITEDLAKRCHDQLGKKILAVVELVAEARAEKRNGDESVSLSILTIEPAPTTETEDHLRNLARSFHYERQLAAGEAPTLEYGDGPTEPNVADVLATGARHEPHPYLSSSLAIDDSEHGPVCDVCGQHEGAAVHADRSALVDPFATPEADEDGDEDGDGTEPGEDHGDDGLDFGDDGLDPDSDS